MEVKKELVSFCGTTIDNMCYVRKIIKTMKLYGDIVFMCFC